MEGRPQSSCLYWVGVLRGRLGIPVPVEGDTAGVVGLIGPLDVEVGEEDIHPIPVPSRTLCVLRRSLIQGAAAITGDQSPVMRHARATV